MVRILDLKRPESFGDKLLRGIQNVGQTLPSGLMEYQKQKDAKDAAHQKRIGQLPKAMKYVKERYPALHETRYMDLLADAKNYLNQVDTPEEALEMAAQKLLRSHPEVAAQMQKQRTGRGPEEGGFIGGKLGQYLKPASEEIARRPSALASEFPVAVGKSAEMTSHDPMGSLLTNLLKTAAPNKFAPKDEEGREMLPNTPTNMLKGYFRQGLSPEQAEGAERISDVESTILDLLPVPGLKGLRAPKIAIRNMGASSVRQAQDKIRNLQQNKTLIGELFKDVFGKKATPKTPKAAQAAQEPRAARSVAAGEVPGSTASRLERVAPESRLYKPGEQAAIREQQLKMEPHYAEEIARDAAERSARQAEKSPKTLVGEAGVAQRKATAEAQLPKVQEGYQRAIARIRALEDELARDIPSAEKARTDALMQMAKRELEEAEFALRQTLNNAKTGEARVGLEQMRDTARNKVLRLSEEVADGKELKLPLRDYNPALIKQAKEIAKKKQIPATRDNDFFTQVHDAYANEYKTRLAQVENEIADFKANPSASVSSLQQGMQLKKERDALQKMIDHVEAENAIHRHKIGLREIGQRKLARERLGHLTKQAGEQKVKELAKNALKSPEQAAEAVDAAVGEAAAQASNDAMRKRILKERLAIRRRMEGVAAGQGKAGQLVEKTAEGPKSEKQAKGWSYQVVNDVKQLFDSIRGEGPSFFRTRIGQDLLVSSGTEFVREIFNEYDIPISHTAALAAVIGRPGRGSAYRALFSSLIGAAVKKYKKERYKSAIERGDDELALELNKKYPAKLRKEALQELH